MRSLLICLVWLGVILVSSLSAQTVLYQDGFDDGNVFTWDYEDGWQVISEGNNFVFEGQGHKWATPPISYYSNATFQAKFKLLEGGFHFNILFRSGRYFFIINSGFVEFVDNTQGKARRDPGVKLNVWHTVKVLLQENYMKFFLNDSLWFEYNDPVRTFLFGKLAFECVDHIYIDDILITGESSPLQGAWVRTGGPWGGIGYDVRIDPKDSNIMYVTDQWAGNHKSTNGGATWYPNNNGIETVFGSTGQSRPIFCLTIDPNNTDIVWCGTFGRKGIYRSTDKGEHWKKRTNGIPDFPCGITFRGFAIRPENSNVVFCGVEIPLCPDQVPAGKNGASRGKIFKTVDFGESWREVLDSNALVRHILIDPQNPDIMYASTGIFDRDCMKEEGVWKSTDGGETWFHANNGLTDLTVGGLFMDPRNSHVLWASTSRQRRYGGDESGEIFRTTDGGNHWQEVFPKDGPTVWDINSITTSGPNSNIIYAAQEHFFFASTDGGVSWSKRPYNIPGIAGGIPVGIAAHPTKEETVFINGYNGGVFVTEDGGTTWAPRNTGYTGAEMLDIIVDPINPLKVLAVGRSGVADTDNGGFSWKGAGNIAGSSFPIGPSVLSINHLNRNSFLTGEEFDRYLYKTTDRFNWSVIYDFRRDGIEEGHCPGAMQYAYNDSNIIYVGLRYRTLPFIIDRPEYYDPNIISYGMFKSTNGGRFLTAINNGLGNTTKNIQAIAIHPGNPDTVFIGLYGFGVYKTTDGGKNWQEANNGLPARLIASLTIDKNTPRIIYVGAEGGGLYKSTNGGVSWKAKMTGMDPEASIRSIVIDPTNSQIIYAADWRSGVYCSRDGGERWWALNDGLATRSVQKLAIASDGQTLYVATQGEGVFRLSYENKGPAVQYIYPGNDTTIALSSGKTQEFIIGAIDFNGDSLRYAWLLDNKAIAGANKTTYRLNGSTLTEGNHLLQCDITDRTFVETVKWNLFVKPTTAVKDGQPDEIPKEYSLLQNYPNPFNTATTIKFAVKASGRVLLNIYDITGRRLKTLIDEKCPAGYHQVVFDASDLTSGLYFYEIKMADFRAVKKLLFLK